ncbi:hypothetical protein HDU83_002780 [Entophlyctis luteolus]|nr:hypothetical protein HDU83_002780 [Entophlyctis luteolus]
MIKLPPPAARAAPAAGPGRALLQHQQRGGGSVGAPQAWPASRTVVPAPAALESSVSANDWDWEEELLPQQSAATFAGTVSSDGIIDAPTMSMVARQNAEINRGIGLQIPQSLQPHRRNRNQGKQRVQFTADTIDTKESADAHSAAPLLSGKANRPPPRARPQSRSIMTTRPRTTSIIALDASLSQVRTEQPPPQSHDQPSVNSSAPAPESKLQLASKRSVNILSSEPDKSAYPLLNTATPPQMDSAESNLTQAEDVNIVSFPALTSSAKSSFSLSNLAVALSGQTAVTIEEDWEEDVNDNIEFSSEPAPVPDIADAPLGSSNSRTSKRVSAIGGRKLTTNNRVSLAVVPPPNFLRVIKSAKIKGKLLEQLESQAARGKSIAADASKHLQNVLSSWKRLNSSEAAKAQKGSESKEKVAASGSKSVMHLNLLEADDIDSVAYSYLSFDEAEMSGSPVVSPMPNTTYVVSRPPRPYNGQGSDLHPVQKLSPSAGPTEMQEVASVTQQPPHFPENSAVPAAQQIAADSRMQYVSPSDVTTVGNSSAQISRAQPVRQGPSAPSSGAAVVAPVGETYMPSGVVKPTPAIASVLVNGGPVRSPSAPPIITLSSENRSSMSRTNLTRALSGKQRRPSLAGRIQHNAQHQNMQNNQRLHESPQVGSSQPYGQYNHNLPSPSSSGTKFADSNVPFYHLADEYAEFSFGNGAPGFGPGGEKIGSAGPVRPLIPQRKASNAVKDMIMG